jgi:hypothetical protein
VHQVGDQPGLYYDARSANHQGKTLLITEPVIRLNRMNNLKDV